MINTQINNEWQLLDKIKETIEAKNSINSDHIVKSIGDDCAAFRLGNNRIGLITTDISIESIHFNLDLSSPEEIGFKAIMGGISDITAMGGESKLAFISIGIPVILSQEYVLRIYDGMIDAANRASVLLVGGDTSRSRELIINITIYGEVDENRIINRNSARDGDIIYITGHIGDSRAGMEILESKSIENREAYKILIERHTRPIARFDIIDEIIQIFNPTSMIDISDGLLSDLRHICNESLGGFIIEEEAIPLSKELLKFFTHRDDSVYEYALSSGEEYELLFTSPKELTNTMKININNIPINPIGRITDKGFYIMRKNALKEVQITGYNHFK
ncbi:MAG: thiamine-phosphate kinase [Spirochaetota bacterium]|nr:thiamine-phosphate kinase [Spirochaetota bacterium]